MFHRSEMSWQQLLLSYFLHFRRELDFICFWADEPESFSSIFREILNNKARKPLTSLNPLTGDFERDYKRSKMLDIILVAIIGFRALLLSEFLGLVPKDDRLSELFLLSSLGSAYTLFSFSSVFLL